MNPNINCELGGDDDVSGCRLISCNKRPILMSDVDDGEACACIEAGAIKETSASSSQFYKPETVLLEKIKSLKRVKIEGH